jgi:hypothetical protein
VPILNSEGESILVPMLAGGVSRSGKSGLAWALLAGFIEAGIPVRVRVLDLGGGTEFAALRHAFDNGLHTDLFRVHSYTSKISDAEKVLAEAAKAMDARLYTMGKRGQRVHKPTVDEPYDLVLCDEMLRMRAVLKKAHEGPMGDLLSQGRRRPTHSWGSLRSGTPTSSALCVSSSRCGSACGPAPRSRRRRSSVARTWRS